MNSRKAQGAMEYLMTYGWAILVVMIVGLAMWRLGVFDLSQGGAPTSSGFGQVKPLLPSCKITNDNWLPATFSGFTCQFANTAGAEIRVKDINVTVNDEYCYWFLASIYPEFDTLTPLFAIEHHMGGEPIVVACVENPAAGHCVSNSLAIARDSVFTIATATATGNPDYGPCGDVIPGEPYKVYINLVYDIKIGSDTVEKSTSGTIRLSGE